MMVPEIAFVNLTLVATVAFAAPLLLGLWPRLRLPAVVLEILAGVVLGPSVLGLVPLFLGALLLVRGLPALLAWRRLGPRLSVAAGLLQATSLSFIVAAAQIGMELGVLAEATGAALIAAGLLSVLLFPAAALVLAGGPAREEDAGEAARGEHEPQAA